MRHGVTPTLATMTVMALVAVPSRPGAPSCKPVQCPPAGATTSSWCQANADHTCTVRPTLPSEFTVESGTSITIHVSGKEPVLIPLSEAVGALGSGKLCCGVVAAATTDVALYRAWAPHYDSNSTPPPGYAHSWQFGSWWSYHQPDTESHRTYRTEEDLCVSWNSLTVYSKCTLPKGSQVFIGPGQSICCAGEGCEVQKPQACPGSCPDPTYLLESDILQIYVPDYVEPSTGKQVDSTQKIFEDCETFVWPE